MYPNNNHEMKAAEQSCSTLPTRRSKEILARPAFSPGRERCLTCCSPVAAWWSSCCWLPLRSRRRCLSLPLRLCSKGRRTPQRWYCPIVWCSSKLGGWQALLLLAVPGFLGLSVEEEIHLHNICGLQNVNSGIFSCLTLVGHRLPDMMKQSRRQLQAAH